MTAMGQAITGDQLFREERLTIGGDLVPAQSGGRYPNVNPATEQVIGVAADGGPADMDRAIAAARAAFDDTTWADDVAFRIRCLRQLQEALERHADELRATTVAEVGCPISLTYTAQLDTPVAGIGWLADLVERYEWSEDLGVAAPFGMRSHRYVERRPYGVVGTITPWNFPTQINLAKITPALAAGNTVVLKPAPETPWTGLLLGRLVTEETDTPPGVFNVVTSSSHEVGAMLAADDRVDLVSFTGSTATGRSVMRAGAQSIKKVFLELGGKSPFVVLDDADMAAVAGAIAFQITAHAGQGCAITSRLILPRSRYDEGLELVASAVAAVPYGDPLDPAMVMGPLISERQRNRVLGYIDKGITDGARVVLGGGVPKHLEVGYFVEPTILADVDQRSVVAQEEIFGPVLAVTPHEGDDHAIQLANDTIYGLSGAVMSGSLERARAVARRIRSGTIAINGGMYYGFDVPFGGSKQSGIGREMGRAGFEEYLELRSVAEGLS